MRIFDYGLLCSEQSIFNQTLRLRTKSVSNHPLPLQPSKHLTSGLSVKLSTYATVPSIAIYIHWSCLRNLECRDLRCYKQYWSTHSELLQRVLSTLVTIGYIACLHHWFRRVEITHGNLFAFSACQQPAWFYCLLGGGIHIRGKLNSEKEILNQKQVFVAHCRSVARNTTKIRMTWLNGPHMPRNEH